MNLLWFFIPDEAIPLLFVGIGLAVICGVINGRTACKILGGLLILLLATPFIVALVGALPIWVSVLIMVIVGIALLKAISSIFIGENSTDHMVGVLAADFVRSLVLLPFRAVGFIFRAISGKRLFI